MPLGPSGIRRLWRLCYPDDMFEYSGETLSGVIDGRNTIFGVSSQMGAGSCSVYLNGILLTPGLDTGWVQLDDVTVQFKEPPELGDVVAVGYASTTAAYRDSYLVPIVAGQANAVPIKPALATLPMTLGGLVTTPLQASAAVSIYAPPGLTLQPLVPELVFS